MPRSFGGTIMSAVVTLHVFSGRPDPTWELSDSQVQEFARKIKSIEETTFLKPPGVLGALGYRGFTVGAVGEKSLESETYVHEGIVDIGRFDLNRITNSPDLERWLLETGAPHIDHEIFDFVTQQLAGTRSFAIDGARILVIPPFEPVKWNNNPTILNQNNCYNYANDKITNTFAQPGRGSGSMYTALDCGNVGSAARRDGQISIPNPDITPAQGHIIALVMAPGYDYHWYRRDSNNMWSHKPGRTPARNVDNAGRPINDPRNCNRDPYTIFCGFFHCIPANTRIN